MNVDATTTAVDRTIRWAAVLGSPVEHSLSPVLHGAAYQALDLHGWHYGKIECDEPSLPRLVDGMGPEWAGLSLTMPLKRVALTVADGISPLAQAVEAANTLVFPVGGPAGGRQAHNTDVAGIVAALKEAGLTRIEQAVILGAGGTAQSALAAVRELGNQSPVVLVRNLARTGDLRETAERLGCAPAVQLSVLLAEAIRARVLEDDGTVLRFRHDLIRESIYADLPASVLRDLHREAGQRLARSGAPALQVAEHLARGAARGDADAIGWLTRAAREAGARSPDVAADLLERAAALMDLADPGRDRLLAERASSLMLAGRIADAAAACRLVLGRDHDRSVTGPVRICLGHVLLAQGHVRDALRELERAAQSPVLTGAESAAALAWAAYARLWLGDLDGAWVEAEAARVAAVSADDHRSISVAMATLARVSEYRGRLGDALQIIDEAVRLADLSPGRLGHRYPVRVVRGHILIELDRLEEARSALSAGRQISEDLGVRWPLPAYQVFLSFERMLAGEWDDAIAELEASLALAEEIGDVYSRGYANGVLSLIRFHRNDLSHSRDAATAAARDLAGWSSGYRTSFGPWPHALILEADGEPGEALATLAGIWDKCASSGLALEYPVIGADLVRLSLAAGDVERAREVSAAVTELASGNDAPWMAGAALRCRGLIENDAEILQAAADAYARGSRPLRVALACEDAGAAFARRGQMDRARPLLDNAVSIYERLDATRDLMRAEAVLREAGIRRGRRVSRRRPQFGWDSLTPAEHRVATLVAEGLSNPQIGQRLFVSGRTVQTHLAHVFAKLDITARAQLAAEVSRHQRIKSADAAGSAGQ